MRPLTILMGLTVVSYLRWVRDSGYASAAAIDGLLQTTIHFQMTVQKSDRHISLFLVLPATAPKRFDFAGEIFCVRAQARSARIPISSRDITGCNWLPGLSGYILTWDGPTAQTNWNAF